MSNNNKIMALLDLYYKHDACAIVQKQDLDEARVLNSQLCGSKSVRSELLVPEA
jgi:hypothetical protein